MQTFATSEKNKSVSAAAGHHNKQQSFFAPVKVQPKLVIGAVGDPYEHEADIMANQVMRNTSAISKPAFFQPKPLTVNHIPRKCASCKEEEKEKVRMKGKNGAGVGMDAPPSVHEVFNRNGQRMDTGTRDFMESRFGYDFSPVHIHNDEPAHRSSAEISALAYTYGNHIVFGSGQYQPETERGKKLLAHELTHVVQQKNPAENVIRRQPATTLGAGGGFSGLMQRDRNAAMQKTSGNYDRGILNCGNYFANTPKQQKYFEHRNDVVDLEYQPIFRPGFEHSNLIGAFWEDGMNEFPVKVQFGSLAKGMISVRKTGDYALQGESVDYLASALASALLFPPILSRPPVIISKEEDIGPAPANFQADPQILILEHPDIDTREHHGSLVLVVEINAGVISGKIGWVNGKIDNKGCPLKDTSLVNTDVQSFIPLIFGTEHHDKQLTPGSSFLNSLNYGYLFLGIMGDLEIDNTQKLHTTYLLNNESAKWEGAIQTNIAGAKTDNLNVERTPQGYISGEDNQLQLDVNWEGKGFTPDAGINITYANGRLSVFGHAAYTDKKGRGNGQVTIVLTDAENAERLFREHLPAGITPSPETESFLDTNLPNPALPLALTAWGNLNFMVTGQTYILSGEASIVVDPRGYIVTAGTLKLAKDYVLVKSFGKWITIFPRKSISLFDVQFGPANIDLSASIEMSVYYHVADVLFKELIASGYYSNRDDFRSEFTLTGVFDIDAKFGANVNAAITATLRAGFKKLGFTLAHASFTIDLDLILEAYARAKPAINLSGPIENHEYRIKGNLNILALMEFALRAGFSMGLLQESKDEEGKTIKKEWNKNIAKRWVLGTSEFNFDFSYLLGSGTIPKFNYSGLPIDKADFLEKLWTSGKTRASNLLTRGSFDEDGKHKGSVQDKPFEPLHHKTDPVGPFALTDSFAMNGRPHMLFLEISGTEGQPAADIFMSSRAKRKLLPQLIDELGLVNEELKIANNLSGSGDFNEKEIKKIEAAITILKTAKAKAEQEIKDAVTLAVNGKMSDTGLEAVGDTLTDYATLSGHTDLGENKALPPTTPVSPQGTEPDGSKVTTPGIDVHLILPAEKSIYLNIYRGYVSRKLLYHSLRRAQRDTNQQKKWDNNQKDSMLRSTKCLGFALDLMDPAADEKARNILRPFWTKKRKIALNSAGDQQRMNVDHVIEWQVRPLTGGGWIDEPVNYELLEPSANSASGTKLDDNIEQERQKLAQITHDISWTEDDIRFTQVDLQGTSHPERYSYHEIETGRHLKDYMRLQNIDRDKELNDQCMKAGGVPF